MARRCILRRWRARYLFRISRPLLPILAGSMPPAPNMAARGRRPGHLALAQGREAEALAGVPAERTRFNPALEASWREQARLLAASGRPGEANLAAFQQQRLSAAFRASWWLVTNHLAERAPAARRGNSAATTCAHTPSAMPIMFEGMRLLARIGIRIRRAGRGRIPARKSALALSPGRCAIAAPITSTRCGGARTFAKARAGGRKTSTSAIPDSPVFQSRLAI